MYTKCTCALHVYVHYMLYIHCLQVPVHYMYICNYMYIHVCTQLPTCTFTLHVNYTYLHYIAHNYNPNNYIQYIHPQRYVHVHENSCV